MNQSGCNYGQHMVDQGPRFEGQKKKGRRENQVMSQKGIIRPDKRKKAKFL